jgi:magnesium chelatase family protein
MNPCPCGWLGHPSARCTCGPDQIRRYRWRVSGALFDRIDMAIEIASVNAAEMVGPVGARTRTIDARKRVASAYQRQLSRQGKANARLTVADVERHCRRSSNGENLLAHAMSRMWLSARGYHRVVKVARTIADIAGCETIDAAHIAEAIDYRRELGLSI